MFTIWGRGLVLRCRDYEKQEGATRHGNLDVHCTKCYLLIDCKPVFVLDAPFCHDFHRKTLQVPPLNVGVFASLWPPWAPGQNGLQGQDDARGKVPWSNCCPPSGPCWFLSHMKTRVNLWLIYGASCSSMVNNGESGDMGVSWNGLDPQVNMVVSILT